jgi:hypothetical protein
MKSLPATRAWQAACPKARATADAPCRAEEKSLLHETIRGRLKTFLAEIN